MGGLQVPWSAHCAPEHAIGLMISNEVFVVGIPADLSAQLHGDVPEVRNADGPVRRTDGRDGFIACPHAVKEISNVVIAFVEMNFVRTDFRIVETGFRGFDRIAPAHVDRSFASFETAAHLETIRYDHGETVRRDGRGRVSMALDAVTRESIEALLNAHSVLLFMKGTRAQPQCGFSAATVKILDMIDREYETVNVLTDATLREGIKAYGQWPTVPQLYVNGELIGGCDIVTELYESGELFELLGLKPPARTVPEITFSIEATAAVRHAMDQQPDEMSLHVRIDARWRTRFELAPNRAHEISADANGIAVLMDPSTAQRANGLFVDTVDTLQGSGFTFENDNAPPAVKQMDVSTLNANIEAGESVYLYDVRGSDERAKAQIKAAVPFDEGAERLIETLPKDTLLVFHCHGGGRSQVAAENYRLRGFVNVYKLAGGIDAWSLQVDPTVTRY